MYSNKDKKYFMIGSIAVIIVFLYLLLCIINAIRRMDILGFSAVIILMYNAVNYIKNVGR